MLMGSKVCGISEDMVNALLNWEYLRTWKSVANPSCTLMNPGILSHSAQTLDTSMILDIKKIQKHNYIGLCSQKHILHYANMHYIMDTLLQEVFLIKKTLTLLLRLYTSSQLKHLVMFIYCHVYQVIFISLNTGN